MMVRFLNSKADVSSFFADNPVDTDGNVEVVSWERASILFDKFVTLIQELETALGFKIDRVRRRNITSSESDTTTVTACLREWLQSEGDFSRLDGVGVLHDIGLMFHQDALLRSKD